MNVVSKPLTPPPKPPYKRMYSGIGGRGRWRWKDGAGENILYIPKRGDSEQKTDDENVDDKKQCGC